MNSKFDNMPNGGWFWLKIWLVTIATALCFVFFAEVSWRYFGHRASAVDSAALWQFWYDRASEGGHRTIVFIGSSRIQAGVSTQVLRERLPKYRVYQLAKYAAAGPIGILRTLASDDCFNGIVVCDTIEPLLLKQFWDVQRNLVEVQHSVPAKFEALVSAVLLSHLAIRAKDTGIWAGLGSFVAMGDYPAPRHICMLADRSLLFDFQDVKDIEQFTVERNEEFRRRYEELNMPPLKEFAADIAEIERDVDKIRKRGGEVVFLRMPSSGVRRAIEEKYHPKAQYWDALAANTRGVWIHSDDLNSAEDWVAPDQSHLDYRDAKKLTNALADELRRRDIVN